MTTQSKILEKVRALMAKAASTPYEGEADSFRQKADELMTRYAIDQWQIDEAEADRRAVPTPDRRDFDMSWWRTNPFRSQLWDMFISVARHCRCKAVAQKVSYTGTVTIPVFGMTADLEWFDMLFTSLMIQMINKVDPQPNSRLTLMENLAMFREAGVPWETAINKMIKHGDFADVDVESSATFHEVYKPWVHEYRRWCKATGHPQSYVNQRTYRRNFADGFADEIWRRLAAMRRMSEQSYDADHDAGSMSIAVRDIGVIIDERVWNEFPDLRPHAPDCDCDRCHRCSNPKCQRPNCKAARQPIKARSSAGSKIDWAAQQAGREAGAQADISGSAARRVSKTPELGEG